MRLVHVLSMAAAAALAGCGGNGAPANSLVATVAALDGTQHQFNAPVQITRGLGGSSQVTVLVEDNLGAKLSVAWNLQSFHTPGTAYFGTTNALTLDFDDGKTSYTAKNGRITFSALSAKTGETISATFDNIDLYRFAPQGFGNSQPQSGGTVMGGAFNATMP